MAPRAAVVIANHQYERYVGAAIDSALAQVGGDVEVIVVDDGSTDGSMEIISAIPGITVVAQDNGGQGSAMNAGFARVTAPVVFFLDADDLLAPDVVERVVEAFHDPDVARVQFRMSLIDGDGRLLDGEMPPVGTELAHGDLRRALVRFPDDIVWQPTSGNAFRTDVLRQILPMPTEPYRICADYHLSNLSTVHGTVRVLDDLGGSYRIHGENADFTDRLTSTAIRANIRRTSLTHSLLIDECRRVGLTGLPSDPDEVRSVTALAMRLISLRLEPGEHPIAADGRFGLARRGVEAAIGRFDLSRIRRIVVAGWFVAMSSVPRRWVPTLAGRFTAVTV